MLPQVGPDRRSSAAPDFYPVENHARPANDVVAVELYPHGSKGCVGSGLHPITFLPKDAIEAIRDAVVAVGNLDSLRRGGIRAVGKGLDVGRVGGFAGV